jgi:D-sedoheptulose 7-phosphate isomerase
MIQNYIPMLVEALSSADITPVLDLARSLSSCREKGRQLFICGNGGSAANAIHIANDLLYGISLGGRGGLRVHALTANQAIVTCLANDTSYEKIFSEQLKVLARKDDILLALSGSGNSGNILEAIRAAKNIGMETFAILGFDGGEAKMEVDNCIHIPVDDMQVSEDFQLIVGHMLMKYLCGEQDA